MLLSQNDIAEWIGYECFSRTAILRFLERNNIPYFYGKDNRLCTTLEAVNDSLMGHREGIPIDLHLK